MGKILSLLLGLLTLGGIAYYVMYSRSPTTASSPEADLGSQPHQQLENVRERARKIEADDARRAEEALRKSEAAESQ